jgi:uracil-DNA glycosylase
VKTKVVIVGEAWGVKEAEKGRPFVGPSGALLDGFLSAQGMTRKECYLTNVFNFHPLGNDLKNISGPREDGIPGMPRLDKGYISNEFAGEIKRLYAEINGLNPNLVVALGSTACWALLHDSRIKKLRGFSTTGITGHKVFPTYHPAAVLREFKLRPIVFSDFAKIAREKEYAEIRRPVRELWLQPTIPDLLQFDRYVRECTYLSVDIETWAGQITCVGFAPSADRAIVIPFVWRGTKDGNYWPDLATEMRAWNMVRRWLNMGKKIVGQNFLYDANYLWRIYGLLVNQIYADTMLTHHAMQPEMEKGLGFLGSIYTDEPSWKFMRQQNETLKKED